MAGVFLFLIMAAPFWGMAAATAQNQPAGIEQPLEILADPGGHLTIEQAAQGSWEPLNPDRDLGDRTRAYWIRVHIRCGAEGGQHWYLVVTPGWDSTVLYIPNNGTFERLSSGTDTPPARRPVISHSVAFPLALEPGGSTTLYLRLANYLTPEETAQHISLSLERERTFVGATRRFNYLQGIYAGIILAMFAYNFVLFFSLRERMYLFYSAYVLSFGCVWTLRADFLFDVLWPHHRVWNADSSFYLVAVAVTASAFFVRSFFGARALPQSLDRVLWGIAVFTLLLAVVSLFVTPQVVAPLLAWVSLGTSLFYGALGALMLARGCAQARFFLGAWLTLIAANVFYILVYLGLLQATADVAHDAVQVGSALECILLAFALADRIKGIKAESERRQLDYTAELEGAVEQRTRELVDANARLEAASITDPLTGLSNRRFVDIAMPRLTTETMRSLHNGQEGSLLICIADLDRFKRVNDSFGHETGDLALKEVAAGLARAIRGGTTLARWGGEEFLLIEHLGKRSEDTAFAERIRQFVAEEVSLSAGESHIRMNVSLGLAHFPLSVRYPELLSWQEVLILADRCLYQAKDAGRNCWFLVRVNEDALENYVRAFGEASASALCRSRFDEALEVGVLELISVSAAIS